MAADTSISKESADVKCATPVPTCHAGSVNKGVSGLTARIMRMARLGAPVRFGIITSFLQVALIQQPEIHTSHPLVFIQPHTYAVVMGLVIVAADTSISKESADVKCATPVPTCHAGSVNRIVRVLTAQLLRESQPGPTLGTRVRIRRIRRPRSRISVIFQTLARNDLRSAVTTLYADKIS